MENKNIDKKGILNCNGELFKKYSEEINTEFEKFNNKLYGDKETPIDFNKEEYANLITNLNLIKDRIKYDKGTITDLERGGLIKYIKKIEGNVNGIAKAFDFSPIISEIDKAIDLIVIDKYSKKGKIRDQDIKSITGYLKKVNHSNPKFLEYYTSTGKETVITIDLLDDLFKKAIKKPREFKIRGIEIENSIKLGSIDFCSDYNNVNADLLFLYFVKIIKGLRVLDGEIVYDPGAEDKKEERIKIYSKINSLLSIRKSRYELIPYIVKLIDKIKR